MWKFSMSQSVLAHANVRYQVAYISKEGRKFMLSALLPLDDVVFLIFRHYVKIEPTTCEHKSQMSYVCNVRLPEIHKLWFFVLIFCSCRDRIDFTERDLAIMWSKVCVGLLLVNIVTLAIWLAVTESDSNGGGEVGKEGCLHAKQVII